MEKRCMHEQIVGIDNDYCLFTWSMPKDSLINCQVEINSDKFETRNKKYYFATLDGFRGEFMFSITTNACGLKCSVSMFIGSGTLLFSNTLKAPTREDYSSPFHKKYDLISLQPDNDCFEKLKQHSDDSVALICRIIFPVDNLCTFSMEPSIFTATDILDYMKKLADALRNSSESFLKEKVTLKVEEKTEVVSKAILCARSPVFAKMFQSDMRESKENVVTISDMKMPVLKVLIHFFYTGSLPDSWTSNRDFVFLCDLYSAADKYDIPELRLLCVDLLLPQVSMENIFQISKLAFSHVDERLKSTVKAIIASNIPTLVVKDEWKDFLNEQPQVVIEALTFFDI